MGEEVLSFRRFLGIRQEELAREPGVEPITLARWERGKGHPDASHEPVLNSFLDAWQPHNEP